MATRAWAIKLGSAGRCVPFCEKHNVVGLGWKPVDAKVLATASREELWAHVNAVCGWYGGDRKKVGAAAGQLYRFAHECKEGDLVLFYDPPKKHVRVARVKGPVIPRDFDIADDTDVWHCRAVEFLSGEGHPIPLLKLHGGVKASLLGPKMSFWALALEPALVEAIAGGVLPPPDPEIARAYEALEAAIVKRLEVLTDQDWEWLVVDYFKAQGAQIDERRVGGSRAIVDLEARFSHGEMGDEQWFVQVKRLKDPVDWPAIERDAQHVGDDARFCYVSVRGFTEEAHMRAQDDDVRLLEAKDFVRFLLSGRVRPRLSERLRLPFVAP